MQITKATLKNELGEPVLFIIKIITAIQMNT